MCSCGRCSGCAVRVCAGSGARFARGFFNLPRKAMNNEDRPELTKLRHLNEHLRNRIRGQDHVISRIVSLL